MPAYQRQPPIQPDEVEASCVERIDYRTHRGYSAVLDLHIRWEDGEMSWYDLATGRHIIRFRDDRETCQTAESRAETERGARIQAKPRAEGAEARTREL